MNQNYKISNVNWKKVLENYRNGYNFSDEWEIALLEIIANSIDAETTRINLRFSHKGEKLDIICEDNGKGMNSSEFEDITILALLVKIGNPKA